MFAAPYRCIDRPVCTCPIRGPRWHQRPPLGHPPHVKAGAGPMQSSGRTTAAKPSPALPRALSTCGPARPTCRPLAPAPQHGRHTREAQASLELDPALQPPIRSRLKPVSTFVVPASDPVNQSPSLMACSPESNRSFPTPPPPCLSPHPCPTHLHTTAPPPRSPHHHQRRHRSATHWAGPPAVAGRPLSQRPRPPHCNHHHDAVCHPVPSPPPPPPSSP